MEWTQKSYLLSIIGSMAFLSSIAGPAQAYVAEWSVTGLYEEILAVDCRDCEEETGILFACQANGQPAEITVNAAASPVGQDGAFAPVTFNIDGEVFTYEAKTVEYGLIGFTPVFEIAYDDPLTEALQAGQQAIVTFNGQQGFIGLKGSRNALNIFKAHCGWTPQGFRSNLARTASNNPAPSGTQGNLPAFGSQQNQLRGFGNQQAGSTQLRQLGQAQTRSLQPQNPALVQGRSNASQFANQQAPAQLNGQLQQGTGQRNFQEGQIRPLQPSGLRPVQPLQQNAQLGYNSQQPGQLTRLGNPGAQGFQQPQNNQLQPLQGQRPLGQTQSGQLRPLQGQQQSAPSQIGQLRPLQGQQPQQLRIGQQQQGIRPLQPQSSFNQGGTGLQPLQRQNTTNQLNQLGQQQQGQFQLQQQAQLQSLGSDIASQNNSGMPQFSQTVLSRSPANLDVDGMFWFTGDGFGRGSARSLAYAIPESDGAALIASCDIGRPGVLLELFASFGDLPAGSNVIAEFYHARGTSRYQGQTFIDNEEYAGSRFLLDPRDPLWANLAQSPQFNYGIQGQTPITLSGSAGAAALIEFGRACQQ